MGTPEIFSSTGTLGLERRQPDRFYCNWQFGLLPGRPSFWERQVERASLAIERGLASRCVLRGFMQESELEALSHASIRVRNSIEAAVPMEEENTGEDSLWMVMFGKNAPERAQRISISQHHNCLSNLTREVKDIRHQGFTFIRNIPDDLIGEIGELWSPIFGWKIDEIVELKDRLDLQRLKPDFPSAWFSGILAQGQVVSVSMAERIDIPIGLGQFISVVESTEWCVRPQWARRRLMTAGLSYLHAQVVQDLQNFPKSWVMIAETNLLSGANFVGETVGMRVPPDNIRHLTVPQVLRQNVSVGDGVEPFGLRDFAMMYLPKSTINQQYHPEAQQQILEEDICA